VKQSSDKVCITIQKCHQRSKKSGLANVPNGTLSKIIKEEEEKSGLSVNSILLDTV
jgi:hypothetical protein